MAERQRRDVQLGMILVLGITAAAAITGFLVYRIASGDGSKALVDAFIVACILAPVVYGWMSRDTRRAGAAMCLLNTVNCALACWLIGDTATGWIYVALMTNFFITTRRLALIASVLLIAVASWALRDAEAIAAITRTVTWSFITMFAYIFASRVNSDRHALERLVAIDALTQVPNRRSMEHALANAIVARRATRKNYGLLVLDIDKFKVVNDTFGHPAGDAVLADLGAVMKFEMRKRDTVYRFGGEEFVVLLRLDDIGALAVAGERIRRSIRDNLRGPGGRITVSVGGAMLDDAQQWQDWFARADEALYQAKRAGGDVCRILDVDDAVLDDDAVEALRHPASIVGPGRASGVAHRS